MPVMVHGVEAGRQMTGRADSARLTAGPEPRGMGIVTVGARDTRLVHATLQEGSVDVDFPENLAIGVIQALLEQRRQVRVHQRTTPGVIFRRVRSARVTASAGLRLHRRSKPDLAADGNTGVRIHLPGRATGIIEVRDEPGPSGEFAGLRLFDVARGRTVAPLAADVDLRPGRRVGVAGGIVSLVEVGRVALGALEIPGLLPAGPVQRVRVRDRLVRVEVKPALPAVRRGPAVPRERQCLEPPARKLDEVLLQRLDAKDVSDREVPEVAVLVIGHDEIIPVLQGERAFDAEVPKPRPGEIPTDGVGSRHLHGQRVMRVLPGGVFGLVTAAAGRGADKLRRSRGRDRRRLRTAPSHGQESAEHNNGAQRSGRNT